MDCERRTTAELIALLAELDTRKLYLGEGCSSLFAYCTQVLRLSEPAAYSRITAARAARRFPTLLAQLASGDISLTTINLLAAHLSEENVEGLLEAARHQSKRDVERLVASLHAQPDIPSSVRRLPEPAAALPMPTPSITQALPVARPSLSTPASRPAVVPISADRYVLRITIDAEAGRKLDRARDLLRHVIPDGDPAAIVDRALLVDELEKKKIGMASRARRSRRPAASPRSRRVPAAVRRAVWSRDHGRCAFVGARGRCHETAFLEFHHVQPFADGGAATIANLQLRCRAHNAHEARLYFGDGAGNASPV